MLAFITGILIGGIGVKNMLTPSWHSQQLKFNGSEFISPQPLDELNIVKPVEAKEKPSKPTYDIDAIVSKVRVLESSNGTAGLALTCKKLGMSNEYGYAPPKCYDSHEQLTQIVYNWFDKRLDNMGLAGSLCYYNKGLLLDDCEYYQKFLEL